jgi:hypothetical protein
LIKKSILDFVDRVTKAGGVDYVPVKERIAPGNDGTLWSERTYSFQIAFALDEVQYLEWQHKKPFKSDWQATSNGVLAGSHHALIEIAAATHSRMTTGELEPQARKWLVTTRHPQTDRLYSEWGFIRC